MSCAPACVSIAIVVILFDFALASLVWLLILAFGNWKWIQARRTGTSIRYTPFQCLVPSSHIPGI